MAQFYPRPDLYAVLQVHERAEQDVIDFTYRKLAKKYHPDVNASPDAQERMILINHAYEILGHPGRRAQYDIERSRRAGSSASAPSGSVTGAAQIMTQYFERIRDGLYHDAYRMLSGADQRISPQKHFVDWRVSVDQLYRLVRFRVGAGRLYPGFEMPDKTRRPACRVVVDILEENRKTGRLSEYSLIKYLIHESGAWRVHLGYSDLGAIVRDLEERANPAPPPSSSVLSALEFTRRLEQECYRAKRYGRPFSLGVFQIEIEKRGAAAFSTPTSAFACGAIARTLRTTDVLGCFSPARFAVILGETPPERARGILNRLSDGFIRQMGPATSVACTPALIPTFGRSVSALAADCRGLGQHRAKDAFSGLG